MFLNAFPDPRQPGFDVDAPCPHFRWPNLLIHAKTGSLTYPEHHGPLTVKCTFQGQVIYRSGYCRFVVGPAHYLILNDRQPCAIEIEAAGEVESLQVYFRPDFAEQGLASLSTPADCLLDDPTPSSSAASHLWSACIPTT